MTWELFAVFIGSSLRLAVPLLLAGTGELVSERAGVLNMSIEGMMLTGAFAAAVGAWATGSPPLGLLIGIIAVFPVALLQAVLSNTLSPTRSSPGSASISWCWARRARRNVRVFAAMLRSERVTQQSSRPFDPVEACRPPCHKGYKKNLGPIKGNVKRHSRQPALSEISRTAVSACTPGGGIPPARIEKYPGRDKFAWIRNGRAANPCRLSITHNDRSYPQ
jgi:hypothetical protein